MALTFKTDVIVPSGKKIQTNSINGVAVTPGVIGPILKSDGDKAVWEELADLTSSVTPGTGISITCGGVYKEDNVVYVQLRLQTTAAIAVSSTILRGLPAPKRTNDTGTSFVRVRAITNSACGPVAIYISNGGNVGTSNATYNKNGGIDSGKVLYLNFSYVC